MITKIIKSERIALKLLVLICLLIRSNFLIPLYSILIKNRPTKPNNKGIIKLKNPGRKPVIFNLNN